MTDPDWKFDEVKPEDWHVTKATVEKTYAWLAVIPGLVIVGLAWMIIDEVLR